MKKTGITGLVYGSIKGVTRLAGGTVNAVLSRAALLAGEQASSPQREAMLSALNGVLGDQLLETANPLAIYMSLRREGKSLTLEPAALARRLPDATAKVLVMVHGLCMNDLQWRSESPTGPHDHGEQLARALGYPRFICTTTQACTHRTMADNSPPWWHAVPATVLCRLGTRGPRNSRAWCFWERRTMARRWSAWATGSMVCWAALR